jgi:hypothetical protein
MSQIEAPSLAKPTLTPGEAGSRLVIVTGIQWLGVGFLVGPLVTRGIQSSGWQRSCLLFGLLAALGAVLLLIMLLYAAKRRFKDPPDSFDVRKTELAITFAFVLNTVALALAMARTGGPSCSTYGQMIPMQLSGMLLLALQKETFTSDRSFRSIIYPVITLFFGARLFYSGSNLLTGRAGQRRLGLMRVVMASFHRVS